MICLARSVTAQVNCDSVDYYLKGIPKAEHIQSLIHLLNKAGDFSNALYMLEQQHVYNPEHRTMDNIRLKGQIKGQQAMSKDCGCQFPARPVWESADGPFGADATAFYEDDQGNYWLGTGSSGGVYFSSDKGQNWEQRNNGIGPWHIADFLEQNDTLFIQVNAIGGGKKEGVRMYYYQTDENKWIFIPGEIYPYRDEYIGYGGMIYKAMKLQRGGEDVFRDPRLNFSKEKEGMYTYANKHLYFEKGVTYDHGLSSSSPTDAFRIFGFKETTPALAKLNKTFPRDVFLAASGNLYDLDNENHILLSKSGPYEVDRMKKIKPLPTNGLVATDVRQVISTRGKLYAMVNEADIWKFENNKWIQIFNAYEHHLKRKNPISLRGYDTRMMNLQKDGRIVFAFCGELWEMSREEKFSKIEIDLSALKNPDEKDQILVIGSGGYDTDGTLYALVEDIAYDADYRDTYYGYHGMYNGEGIIVKILNGKAEVYAQKEIWASFLFNDPLGHLWVSSKNLRKIGVNQDKRAVCPQKWMGQTQNQIAFKPNGNMLVLGDYNIYEWYAADNKWQKMTSNVGERMNSISYGLKGEIIVGTGVWFGQSCDQGPFHGHTDGIFRWDGERWVSIMGCENDWVYGMCIHPTFGLAVGTSGSGVQFLKSY